MRLVQFTDRNLSLAVHLLDFSHDLELCSRAERVAAALEKENEVLSDVSTTKVNPPSRVLNREALVNSTGVAAAITDIEHDTSRETASVQTQHARRMEEEFRYLELLEEHLSGANTITNRIIGWFRQKHRVLSRVDFQLVENVSPDLLHVVPVLNHAMLHRVRQLEDALEFLLQHSISDRSELGS